MDVNYFEILIMAFIGLLSAIVIVTWSKADNAEKTAHSNKVFLAHLARSVEKTEDLAGRLSSLEASFSAEIKNLTISIKRMESAVLRIDQNGRNRPL